MGASLLNFYRNRISREWKIAFFSTVCAFFLVHLYKITNTLPNHDSYYNVYVDQNMTASGRWFLQYACGLSSYFDLDWVIGILCAFWLGVTAVAITALFELRNPVVIALTGAILAACPCTTETLFFGFTADGYLMGLALAALSSYLSCRAKNLKYNLLAGVCLCLCCAIYQSCVSFGIMLCICWLVLELLENRIGIREAWKWILRHVLVYAVSMGAYYLIWKLILAITGTAANHYQGIDTIGQLGISTVLSGAVKSVSNLFFLFLEWNILEHPITLYGVLNIIFLLSFAGVLITSLVRSDILKRPGALVLLLIALISSVPMISIWCFLSDGVQYRPMMLHSAMLYYVLAIILFDRWMSAKLSTVFGVLVGVMVFNFAVMSNIAYSYMNYCQQKTYYEGIKIMDTIEEAREEYDSKVDSIAFVGHRGLDLELPTDGPASRIHILTVHLEESLMYDHVHINLYLKHTFDLDLEQLPYEQHAELEALDQVRQMPIWPEDGSSQVIDGVLVVRIGE